jgi:ubiquinone/menaquinone biosynthesis C-methylase UbiE
VANHPPSIVEQIKDYYRQRAGLGNYATSPDFNLREVENDYLSRELADGLAVLDVGCGTGYSTLTHASRWKSAFTGIDFVPEMIEAARSATGRFALRGSVQFAVGDVTQLELADRSMDVVISQRCLLNLPNREAQWTAMEEVARVLRPGGRYLMMEGSLHGLRKLNEARTSFGLEPIPEAEGTYNWFSNKFEDEEMLARARSIFSKVIGVQRFGMYYFISRVIHPLLVSPEAPRYDAPINAVARKICEKMPDFREMGHVALFMFRR